jgi:adenylate cyclase
MNDFEQAFAAIARTTADAIISADSDGIITTWNPAAQHVLGYTPDEVIGKSLTIFIPERFHDAHNAGLARVVETGKVNIIGQTVEVMALHKTGFEIPVELSLSNWTSDGKTYFTGIIRDISRQKKLLSDIMASEQRLEAVLESANDAIITIDSSGIILQWNSYAATLFGYSREETVGGPLDKMIPKRFRDLHRAGFKRVAEGGDPHVIGSTVELAALHKDGREIPIELSLSSWVNQDKIFFSGIVRDITERKRATMALEVSNSELAQKSAMLEALSAKLAKYLSRQVYDSIFEGKTEVKVASYRKKLTIFFSDIQGFTELSDRLEPEPVSALLNEYLSEMSKISMEFGGTVDKFIGDGIMIFFGDPNSSGEQEDALACARMALAMQQKIDTMKDVWGKNMGSIELHVRIGINTGFCTVGNFGSSDRLDYTIVGREVNTASRLESTARPGHIQISDDTYQLIKHEMHCEPLGEINVKGLAYPLKTFSLIGAASDSADTPPSGEMEPDASPALSVEDMSEVEIRAMQKKLKNALNSRTDTPEKE